MTSKRPRVLIAESQLPTRQGIRLVLQRDGFEVCAEAADANAALRGALRERPALCIVDANLRGGGIRAAGRICSRVPNTEVVVLADKPDESELLEAVQAGASGYLQKNMNPEAFSRALRGALRSAARCAAPSAGNRRFHGRCSLPCSTSFARVTRGAG